MKSVSEQPWLMVSLASGKSATASTSYTGYPASNATDGDPGTRWSSQFSDNEWIYVDLGSTRTIGRIVLRWEAAYGRGYKLQVSDNASTWSDVYTTSTGDGGTDDISLSSPASGRYVRMLGTQRGTSYGYSLWEFEVYCDTATGEPLTSLASGKSATASTSYTGLPASQATDANLGTRWSSQFSDNEWIYVDLEASCTITRIVLRWEAAYGRGYKLQVSDDAGEWSDVYSTSSGDGEVDDIFLEAPATGRYVRMLGLRRATQYGYSLYELQVYGPSSPNQTPTVSNINRSTATNTLSALAAAELRGAFTDPDAGDYLQKIKITGLPSHGVLTAAGTCSYTSNDLNQYTAAGGVSFTYDPNGNLTSDGTNLYSYDLENRLIRVRRADTQQELSSYVYDAAGRRVEKWLNGVTPVKYVYDGAHCIAEYNGSGQLLRKYIYGPGVDQPICMIESTGSYAGTYYYHFDGLGSVAALTDDEGDTVQVYEYDVYGRVGATDASHPNRILFTGREYDKETGLYYYRARCYNPQIGRFLQTDPVGYGAGMNWYAYCGNNSTNCVDPTGMVGRVLDSENGALRYEAEDGTIVEFTGEDAFSQWMGWMESYAYNNGIDISTLAGYKMAGGATNVNNDLLWTIQAMIALGYDEATIRAIDNEGITVQINDKHLFQGPTDAKKTIDWDPQGDVWTSEDATRYGDRDGPLVTPPPWKLGFPALALLAHEVEHASQYVSDQAYRNGATEGSLIAKAMEEGAMAAENAMAYAFYKKVPGYQGMAGPRMTYRPDGLSWRTLLPAVFPDGTPVPPDMTWEEWERRGKPGAVY